MDENKVIKYTRLEYKVGSSNKFYEVWIQEADPMKHNGFVVNFRYGRIGTPGNLSTKTPSPVSLAMAEKVFSNVRLEKEWKGYQPVLVKDYDKHSYLHGKISTHTKNVLLGKPHEVTPQDPQVDPPEKKKKKSNDDDDEPRRSILV